MIPDDRSALALVRSVAELIGAGMDAEPALVAIADTLRRGLGAERVRLWVRATGATWFGVVGSPDTLVVDKGSTTQTILAVPEGDGQEASVQTPQ